MMKRTLFLLFGLVLVTRQLNAQPYAPVPATSIRVACVGASITAGFGTKDPATNNYAAQMQVLLGPGWNIRNFGTAGSTLLKQGDRPYWNEPSYQEALVFNPNIVVIDLGGNDSKAINWRHKDAFAADASALIDSFRALPSHPRVILCLPMPSFAPPSAWINDDIIAQEQIPLLRQVAFETSTEVVDLHTPFIDKKTWFADGVHPNEQGAALMAKIISSVLAMTIDAGFNIERNLDQLGVNAVASSFHGYRQLDFPMEGGRRCTIVRPFVTETKRPFVWRGEFFGHEPQTDLALLERGYHVVYIDTKDMFGAPLAMKLWEEFHALLERAGLSGKITLIGMSRGALYCYNWAAIHPETVAVIYGDAPVCDFKSWPGCKGRSKADSTLWPVLLEAYGFKTEAEALAYQKNPIDNLAPLARAGIPIIHVIGEADTAAPVEENSDLVEQRYKQLGGVIEVIRKPGAEHHPHSLPNPEPIVNFILSHVG